MKGSEKQIKFAEDILVKFNLIMDKGIKIADDFYSRREREIGKELTKKRVKTESRIELVREYFNNLEDSSVIINYLNDCVNLNKISDKTDIFWTIFAGYFNLSGEDFPISPLYNDKLYTYVIDNDDLNIIK